MAPHQNLQTSPYSMRYTWLLFFITASFVLFKYILEISPSVLASDLMSTFHLNGFELGLMASSYFYAYLLMQIPVGVLLDYFSVRWLIALALLTCTAMTWLMSYTNNALVLTAARFITGLFAAFSAVGTMKVVTLIFKPCQFATMSGLMMSIAMIGAVAGQSPLVFLVQHVGWRHSLLIISALGLLISVCFMSVSAKLQQYKTEAQFTKLSDLLRALISLLKQPNNWLVGLYSGLAFAPISTFVGLWGLPYFNEVYNAPKTTMALVISLTFIGFAVGAPTAGWLSNLIGRRKPIMFIGSLAALILLLICLYSELSIIQLACCLFFMGMAISCFFVSFATISESNPHRFSGTSIGFINMFNALISALMEPLIGKFLDLHWQGKQLNGTRIFSPTDYHHAFIILPIGLLISLVCVLFIKETYCQQVY